MLTLLQILQPITEILIFSESNRLNKTFRLTEMRLYSVRCTPFAQLSALIYISHTLKAQVQIIYGWKMLPYQNNFHLTVVLWPLFPSTCHDWCLLLSGKGKGKILPRTGHEGTGVQQMYSSTLS
jgi:hypothetical protein